MSSLLKGTPTTGAILRHYLDKRLAAFGSALPGTVVSYSKSERTATVRPGVHKLTPALGDDEEDVVETMPALQDVPVCWPQGRGFALADVDLLPGDPVLLICMDRDMSGWQRSGEPSEPEDARAHHWGSAVAIPGLAPDSNPIPAPTDSAALTSAVATAIIELRTVVNTLAAALGVVPPPFAAPFLLPAAVKAQLGSHVLKLGA